MRWCFATCLALSLALDQLALARAPGRAMLAILPAESEEPQDGRLVRADEAVRAAAAEIGALEVKVARPSELSDPRAAAKFSARECLDRRLCVQELGVRLKARYLLEARATESLDGATLTVRVFDANSGLALAREAEFISKDADPMLAIRRLVWRALAGPVRQAMSGTGGLVVGNTAQVSEIVLDGQRRTIEPGRPIEVGAGVHRVLVRKDGYLPYEDVLLVRPGAVLTLNPALERDPATAQTATLAIPAPQDKSAPVAPPAAPLPPPQKDQKRFYQTWWFWTVVGSVVLASAGAAVVLGLRGGDSPGQGGFSVAWE